MQTKFDCLIIGGGPAGLAAGVYLARYHRKVMIVDCAESRTALIPESHNYPGFAHGVSGRRLLALLKEQADGYGAGYCKGRIISLEREKQGFWANMTEIRCPRRSFYWPPAWSMYIPV
ncbi:FAD-dependent oxidoreductase [uncultured Bradyrhizobium sp.]|uniref:FAD-dependent oxidoreductase n=1 Tax=uncultured Bradyrhizobium sp. TaxID=199684 RepID=UPI0035C9C828